MALALLLLLGTLCFLVGLMVGTQFPRFANGQRFVVHADEVLDCVYGTGSGDQGPAQSTAKSN
jgi:hypothetical protein